MERDLKYIFKEYFFMISIHALRMERDGQSF